MIQKAIREAVDGICKANGIEVAKDSCSYSNAGLHMRYELNEIDAGGENLAQKAAFERCAEMFGVRKTDYGRTLTHGGKIFKLTEISPKRRRFPFGGIEVGTTKQYKFPRQVVQAALGYETQPAFTF